MLRTDVAEVAVDRPADGAKHGKWWFTPAALILLPVTLSFLAWVALVAWCALGQCVAGSALALRGFLEHAAINAPGVTLILVWYAIVVLFATIGWHLGVDTDPTPEIVERTTLVTFERRYFLIILTVAFAGVMYSYYKIGSATSLLGSLATQTGNSFTNSLSGSAGLETLRYAAVLAAPISVYLWRKKAISPIFVVIAVGLLLLNSMIASRLSLLMAIAVYLAIRIKADAGSGAARKRSGQALIVLAAVVVLFAALTGLNYVRNGNYYRAAGVSNPIAMNAYQMGSYLAVPAQVTMGVARAVMDGTYDNPGSPVKSLSSVQPSFLQLVKTDKDDDQPGGGTYGFSVSFAPNFTTNSVFADTYSDFGAWGWIYTMGLYSLAGYILGRLMRYGPVVAGTGGVLAYCLCEVWRIQLLTQGIAIFLVILTLGGSLVAGLGLNQRRSGQRTGSQREIGFSEQPT